MPRLDIVADDGYLKRRILTIVRARHSVVVAFTSEGKNYHYTYHSNGESYLTTVKDGVPKLLGQYPPLDQFEGFYQFPGWGLAKSLVDQKEPKKVSVNPSKRVTLKIGEVLKGGMNPSFLVILIEAEREALAQKILNKITGLQIRSVSYLWRGPSPWILAIALATKSISAPAIVFIGDEVLVIQVSDGLHL